MSQERIGYCAWCGALDHHLVNDLCPVCQAKTVQQNKGMPDNEPLDIPRCIRRSGLELARLAMTAKAARTCN